MTDCAEPFIGQFSIWKCKRDGGREVIVLSSNSSWIHRQGAREREAHSRRCGEVHKTVYGMRC